MIGGELIKGISGGERKRTSVGVELVTKPSLCALFGYLLRRAQQYICLICPTNACPLTLIRANKWARLILSNASDQSP
eukprot:scaffold33937_cov58-Skeletonema_marinoi.AAC.1